MGGRAGFVRARGGLVVQFGRVDSGFLGNPPRQGLPRGYMGLCLSASNLRTPPDKGVAHLAGVPMAVMVEKGQLGHLLEWHLGAPYPVAPA